MAINLRELIVRDYETTFRDVPACVLVNHTGYSAEDTKRLRKTLHERGARMKVIRNRLARLAFGSIGWEPIEQALNGPVSIVYGEDGIEVSKAIVEWNRSNRPLPITGGFIEGAEKFLSRKDILELAMLPDLKTMQANVLAVFITPVRNVVNCFQASLASFVQCVQAHIEKMEGAEGETSAEAG
ncbi:MAG: 50S ribosomal protein L10 [Planctomycetota bacterium]|jgi:large subunit ribosomal protein L10